MQGFTAPKSVQHGLRRSYVHALTAAGVAQSALNTSKTGALICAVLAALSGSRSTFQIQKIRSIAKAKPGRRWGMHWRPEVRGDGSFCAAWRF